MAAFSTTNDLTANPLYLLYNDYRSPRNEDLHVGTQHKVSLTDIRLSAGLYCTNLYRYGESTAGIVIGASNAVSMAGSLSVTGAISGGSYSTSGDLSCANLTVSGNLAVTGTTTYIDVPTVRVEDNITLTNYHALGAGVAGNDGGFIVQRHVDDLTGVVVGSTSAGGTAVMNEIVLAVGDTQADDFYNGWVIEITAGTAIGDVRLVTDYRNADNTIVVAADFSALTDATSVYDIFGPAYNRHVGIFWDESRDEFALASMLADPGAVATVAAYQTLHLMDCRVDGTLDLWDTANYVRHTAPTLTGDRTVTYPDADIDLIVGARYIIEQAGTGAAFRLPESTGSGTDYIEHTAPVTLTANRTVTYPDADVDLTAVTRYVMEGVGTAAALRLYESTGGGTDYIEQIGPAVLGANRSVTWPDADLRMYMTPRVYTENVVEGDFTAAAQTETINLTALPANIQIIGAAIEIDTAFGGGGLTVATFELGINGGAVNDIFTSVSGFTGTGPGFLDITYGTEVNAAFRTATTPTLTLTVGGGEQVVSATAGDIHIHIFYLAPELVT